MTADDELYDELSRLNNELVNLQRKLAKKNAELESALEHIETLQGLLPICANCKMIRNDDGSWTQVESYVSQRSKATFSHSICPSCQAKLYPELDSS